MSSCNSVCRCPLGTLQPAGTVLQPGCKILRSLLATACRCPPGHGDIYCSLLGSGMLDRLVKAGIKYLFVSNSDNLGEAEARVPRLAHAALAAARCSTSNDQNANTVHLFRTQMGTAALQQQVPCNDLMHKLRRTCCGRSTDLSPM